jgi:hypothetical protein
MEKTVAAQDNSQNDGLPGTLNVLLHGAFAFVEDKKRKHLIAAIPKLKEHAYRAGSWLAETELLSGSYELKGVTASNVLKYERKQNLLLYFQPRQLSAKPVPYATLRFPYPNKITSLRVVDTRREYFTHDEDLVENPQHMATLQVLTYDIDDENGLALKADNGDGHYWEPSFTRDYINRRDYINLHVFSSEEHYYKPSNAREDFNQCVALLGAKLRLQTRFLPASEIPDDPQKKVLPPGVAPQETEDLALRTLRLARLGRLIVENGDTNLAWKGIDALDGDPQACSGLGGCLRTLRP